MRAHARWSTLLLVPWAMAACDLVNDPSDLVDASESHADAGDVTAPGDGPSDDRGMEGGVAQFCSRPLVPATSPASGRWCDSFSPQLFFCSDFDDDAGSLTGQGWDMVYTDDGGSIDLAGTGARTPPNAAFVQTDPPVNGATQAYVQRAFSMPNGFDEACLEFDVDPDSITDSTQVASINLTDQGNPVLELGLVFGMITQAGLEWELPDGSSFMRLPASMELPTSTWTRVRLHLRLGGDAGAPEVDVTYGNQITVSAPVPAVGPSDSVFIQIGGLYIATTTQGATFNAHLDDVTFEVR